MAFSTLMVKGLLLTWCPSTVQLAAPTLAVPSLSALTRMVKVLETDCDIWPLMNDVELLKPVLGPPTWVRPFSDGILKF